MEWTPERTELAKKLWLDGRSAGDIAAILGDGATRNSVLGKLHRQGLVGAENPGGMKRSSKGGAALASVKRKRAAATKKLNQPSMKFGADPDSGGSLEADLRPLRGDAWAALPGTGPVSLLDRRIGVQCCWPLGDPLEPGFAVCGAPVVDGASYCPTHTARATTRPPERVRRPAYHATAVARVF